ncbi:MAG: chromosome segregation protein SMC [Gammaproteobacteria bacterium]|nr:chromosome segregation protein SMC [Gammaproteobacteria bacterium]
MRLKKLQVSGFKSFVDPTDIRLPSNLVGVVGPNGCGKSNVIDAVRWVMGESSAKMLRGDNMTDVIFNGSSSRKPVGKASVELIFDNSEGRATGNYAQFAEISIKRTLTRDGQSIYAINNIKTRRKDVLDLFRGTGLGPRSYSFIEQGMVSRIVEARPDDLRVFVEEAAGTLKYKDRRRETENRIRHTRENLERVSDISAELEKQLRRLKRQSTAAQRYKELKEEERLVNGQLQYTKLKELQTQLEEQDRVFARHENQLELALAGQRETEALLEKLRQQQIEAQENNNQVQQEYYGIGAEVRNIEQRIEHIVDTKARKSLELERLKSSRDERQRQIDLDRQRETQLTRDLDTLMPEWNQLGEDSAELGERLNEAESILQGWLSDMESFSEQVRVPAQAQEVQKSRIIQLERHLDQAKQTKDRFTLELESAKDQMTNTELVSLREQVVAHDLLCDEAENELQITENTIHGFRHTLQQKREQHGEVRTRQQDVISRLNSLKEIQVASLKDDDGALQGWLLKNGFADKTKLAESISVKDGWEKAADRLLSDFLGAVCLEAIPSRELVDGQLDCHFTLVSVQPVGVRTRVSSAPRLIDKISSAKVDLSALLDDVFIAEDVEEALSKQRELIGRECFVTRDGALVGSNWVSFVSRGKAETGVLVREEEINQLEQKKSGIEENVIVLDEAIDELLQERDQLEIVFQQQKSRLNQLRSEKTSYHNRLGRDEARYLEIQQRIDRLSSELTDLDSIIDQDNVELEKARELLEEAEQRSGDLQIQRENMTQRRDVLQSGVSELKVKFSDVRERYHQKSLQKQRFESAIDSVMESIKRLQQQYDASNLQLSQMSEELNEVSDPIDELREQLQTMLDKRVEIEGRFSVVRDASAELDNQILEVGNQRTVALSKVNDARDALDQHRMLRQETFVRKETQNEALVAQGYDENEVAQSIPEDGNAHIWQDRLSTIEGKIHRIGPVNLVAIDEFNEENQRKEYLDRQHADLVEALDTLESVIRKIDKETRAKFKETFELLNTGFNEFFPRLFGGGRAELQLTSDDLLTAGVSVIARPPGKRNSTIHLLSGGEKALTAVALLFALFKLNPAPFCMLDEVDAPLDDANVDRYCNTLKALSEISQIIVITHNKITMEAAKVLVGVTMVEPGVSRMVSVDIEQAIDMASQ